MVSETSDILLCSRLPNSFKITCAAQAGIVKQLPVVQSH